MVACSLSQRLPIETFKDEGGNLSPKRVVIESRLSDVRRKPNVSPEYAQELVARLRDALRDCGAEVMTWEPTGMEIGVTPEMQELRNFHADAVLVMEPSKGGIADADTVISTIIGVWLLNPGESGDEGKTGTKPGSRMKTVWRAQMRYEGRPISLEGAAKQDGSSRATELTAALKRDGFFPGCVPHH
jgi:hypothetical protein